MASLHRSFVRLAVLVFVSCSPAVAFAQSQLLLGANLGIQIPSIGSFSQDASFPFRSETATQQSDYNVPTGLVFDASARYMVRESLGVSFAMTRYSGNDNAGYSLTLPHPTLFNRSETRTGTTSQALTHTERGFHFSAVYVMPERSGLHISVFGGPSKIYISQQLIDDLGTTQTLRADGTFDFTIDSVSIAESDDACACGWGINLGVDVMKSLTPTIGVGGLIRYSRAAIDIKDAPESAIAGSLVTQSLTAGGVAVVVGVRLALPLP